jgi:glutaredoxin
MFCSKVKELLSQNKIEFVDRNIAADEAALTELEKLWLHDDTGYRYRRPGGSGL